jgi:5-hydroxyisourate hydrolase
LGKYFDIRLSQYLSLDSVLPTEQDEPQQEKLVSAKSPITTHVLDLHHGRPAVGVAVTLEKDGKVLAKAVTNSDGRVESLLPQAELLKAGIYRMTFLVEDYFRGAGIECFYPHVCIVFRVEEGKRYHVPLLLSAHGYSTYRGS